MRLLQNKSLRKLHDSATIVHNSTDVRRGMDNWMSKML